MIRTWRAKRAKTIRQKTVRVITSANCFTEWRRAFMMVFKPNILYYISYSYKEKLSLVPGMIETVFRALRTLKVLRPAKFPISTNDVRYPDKITMKSSQFQGFLR